VFGPQGQDLVGLALTSNTINDIHDPKTRGSKVEIDTMFMEDLLELGLDLYGST